jgi:hypothetical protein
MALIPTLAKKSIELIKKLLKIVTKNTSIGLNLKIKTKRAVSIILCCF